MRDEWFWLILWLVLGILVNIGIYTSMSLYNKRVNMYIEGGYTRTTLPGVSESYWVKEAK